MWRGTLLNELINLPIYWWKVFRVDTTEQAVSKETYGSHGRQYFLHARPKQTTQQDIVIYLHGGGWWLGKPEQFQQNAQFFTRKGYEVFLPSYRRVPRYDILDIRQDLVTFFKLLRIKYRTNRLPRILLAGMSAGGHLASLLALDHRLLEEAGWSSQNILGLISWCGPVNLEKTNFSLPQYWLTNKLKADQKDLANPFVFLSRDISFPIIVIHGTKDGMVNSINGESFVAQCNALGLDHRSCKLPNTHLEIATWSIPESIFWDNSRKLLEEANITNN